MRVKLWLLAVGMVVAGIANAAQMPNVSYSADSYMESAEGVTKGPVYVAPGKQRREYVDDSGNSVVMIIRQDKKVTWMLMPNDEMYMEIPFPKEGRKDDLSSYKIDSTTVGQETVNGVKTTKSKVIMTGPNGEKMGGFWWATQEGIIVKMDTIAKEKDEKVRFKVELHNLKIGKQDPSLFEVPDDYTKMDMSMGGIGAMMMGGDDEDDGDNGKDAEKKPEKKPEEKKKGFSWKDAIDILK